MKTYYSTKPEPIMYMPHDNIVDCWLRKNIEPYENDDGNGYMADEVYIQTDLTYDEVEEKFNELFENPTIQIEKVTIEERLNAIEEAILELALGGQ